MNDRLNSSDYPPTDIPTSSQGFILQRGGEELILEKVSDRFTVRPQDNLSPQDLSQANWGNWRRNIPKAQLALFAVPPSQLEGAMSVARASDDVAFASHVYQIKDSPSTRVYLTDQITIQFATWVDSSTINAIATKFGLIQQKSVPSLPNTFVFIVGKQAQANPIKISNQLIALPEVVVAEPNIITHQQSHYQPRDPLYPQQWYLNHNGGNQLANGSHISVEKAWDITRGIRSVVVAVVDDSFDLNHPDFQGSGKIVAPRDLKENDFLPLPNEKEASHGTACAGIILAEENGTGIAGVAPGCAFMPIRSTGFLDDESIEDIFNWAVEKGASIISCSWGASAIYFPLSLRQRAAITRAATKGRNGKGCVIFFSAGNANRPVSGTVNEQGWQKDLVKGNTKWLSGFAVHPDVITVSASTSLNKKAAYSNWGNNISVCAPSNNALPGMWFQDQGYVYTQPSINTALSGRGILTTDQIGAAGYDPGNFTSNFGGTSSATPVVAGVAALVLSVNPDLTAKEVKRILEETADKIVDLEPDPQLKMRYGTYDENGHSQWFGYGKVNAWRAVQAAQKLRTATFSTTGILRGENTNKVAIPDNDKQGIKSAIAITDSSLVKDIQVSVNITHDFLGDLEIYLIAPNNHLVLLQNRTLGRRIQLQATYTVRSHPVLQQLLSLPAKGRWQLWVIDYALKDTGKLNSWELILGI
ncbi:S8 family serine peptidase [Fischerella thermalis]|jgi:subtilisin family serine protease|uniref:Peptidase S8 and S53 subtilisin kexin sedolisin n=1 Tax=Fischerella thermalis JSC-11 TaxID=741277 RepID=G6FRM7_9CYAN|nr:S8 family serine peptidase [Fischerella thermalis]PMB09124.1 peptidase S8 [Fischerella thermalis CCMEE 5273]EHC16101.1 peptidase S8 and S53 subtilisin kexin sedolisin [Fischerella thermalis JSC-11]PLZ14911.1 peptidase S8 [Fischerella thermalis WC114]PLZ15241.1 peptidase S8 [Fischerella thermalis WC119]PLZ16772.1 peptidase S8 [Fischerella thermalis WC157]